MRNHPSLSVLDLLSLYSMDRLWLLVPLPLLQAVERKE